MIKELIIKFNHKHCFMALLENGMIVELSKDVAYKQDFTIGDVYVGKVKKIVKGLNAVFIDIGNHKDAFLHYDDLGSYVKSLINFTYEHNSSYNEIDHEYCLNYLLIQDFKINKKGSIEDVLNVDQDILVQVKKESISKKGPKLTCQISLSGKYLVIFPFSNKISISKKINKYQERIRLLKIVTKIKPFGFGIIIRTISENKNIFDLQKDLFLLEKKWKTIFDVKTFCLQKPPFKIIVHDNHYNISNILRNIIDCNYTSIKCNNKLLLLNIKSHLYMMSSNKVDLIEYYDNNRISLFEKYNIKQQLNLSMGRIIPLINGVGYIIIEHTEALHVIDVNSSGLDKSKNSIVYNSLEINKIAASEIAKQLRLRDMGGIIVVDFIDMMKISDKKELYNHLKNEMEKDKSKHEILPPSKFGLVQITRERIKGELNILNERKIRGINENNFKIKNSDCLFLYISKIENSLRYVCRKINKNFKILHLHVHPCVASYLMSGFLSIRMRWSMSYMTWIKIISQYSFQYLEFKFKFKDKTVFYYKKN